MVLMIALLMTLLPADITASALSGSGTKIDPYVVTTYDELYELLDLESHTFINDTDMYVKLGADIISEDGRNDYYFKIYSSSTGVFHDKC